MVSEPVRRYSAVAVGGALGTSARFGVEHAWPTSLASPAWATLTVNVVGSFVLALVVTWLAARRPQDRTWRPFIATGICGGFTTFSSVTLELVQRGRHHHLPSAAAELLLTLALGLLGALGGIAVAGALGGADSGDGPIPDPDDIGAWDRSNSRHDGTAS